MGGGTGTGVPADPGENTSCFLTDGRVCVIGVSIYSQGTGDSEVSQSASPLPSKKTMRVTSRGRGAGSALTGMEWSLCCQLIGETASFHYFAGVSRGTRSGGGTKAAMGGGTGTGVPADPGENTVLPY